MPVFPSKNIQVYNEKGSYIKSQMEDFYTNSSNSNILYWNEASIDSRFEAGDQRAFYEVHPEIPNKLRKQFNFNRIRKMINMISGFQRRNRKSMLAIPVENGDQETADQYSKVLSHISRKQGVLETLSNAFNDSLITGISLLHVWNDFSSDPVSGTLKVDNYAYNSFLIDPDFKRQDLSDCRQIWKRSYLTKRQIKSLLPKKSKIIDELSFIGTDGKFTFMPEYSNVENRKLMAYDEYYYMDSRKQTIVIDATTGESWEYKRGKVNPEDEEFKEFLRVYPDLLVETKEVSTVKLAILVNGTLLYDGENTLGIDKYPFIPVIAYFKPSLPEFSLRIQGVVRGLRDAQFLYNRRKAIEDDILSSQVNSGFIYKEDALVNPKDIFMTGQGKGIALKHTAQMTDVQKINSAQIPPSMFELSEGYAREIMEISGVNEELLGSAIDDKAGVLAMLRQGAGLTTLQPLFDNLDYSQKLLGSVLLESISANYSVGKIKRIIEEEPAPQFYDKAFGKYDIAIEEGINTTTQRQQEFASLLHLKEAGINIPESAIINASTLQNKNDLIKSIEEANNMVMEQEAKREQVELELKEAQMNLANAKVESDLSLAKERDSRVFSNLGLMEERQIEAEKDKTQSMLNLVKALQEIDNVTLEQMSKMIQLGNLVEADSLNNNKVEKAGVAITSGATKDVPNVPSEKSVELSSEK